MPVPGDVVKAASVSKVPVNNDVVVAILHPAYELAVPVVSPVRVTDCADANLVAVRTFLFVSAVLSTFPRPTVDFENVAHVGAPDPLDLRYYPEVPAPVGA